jgi:dTDP-glucose pyrophosphorylase
MKTLNIVIPMAGRGSRFEKAGYDVPKPLIEVAGQKMIELVIKNVKPSVPHKFIFICLSEHSEEYDLHTIFTNAIGGSDYEVVLLDDVTAGAACTVLCAKEYIDNYHDLVTVNSDQYLALDFDDFITEARREEADGHIMTFVDSDPKWSFAKIDDAGRVTETAEKVPISENATVGIYYFSRGKDFVSAAEAMIRKNSKQNGEFYVCPAYNEMIAAGAHIRIHDIHINTMHGLGTPEDLELFLKKIERGIVTI